MTKERRLAIKMWQEIVDMLEKENIDVDYQKNNFCKKYHVLWSHGCWFCQYVRKEYRSRLKSRRDIDFDINGCENCPLYKEFQSRNAIPEEDFCGCSTNYETLYSQVVKRFRSRTEKLNSAKKILELLKGNKD